MENNSEFTNDGEVMTDEVATQSIWKTMIGVFTSPSETFVGYVRKPSIWIPLVIILVLASAYGTMTASYNAQLQYDIMQHSRILPPQVLEQMQAEAENPGIWKAAIGGFVAPFFITLIVALIGWGIGTFIFGGSSKFKAIWGVTILAALIPSLCNLIVRLPMIMAKGDMYVSIGLAALFPDMDFRSIFYTVMYYLDAFAIWSMIVTGIGYARALNISTGKGIATSVIVSLVITAVFIGLSVVGMSFAGIEITWF